MGNEVTCTVRFGKQESTGKALLETSEILFRGDFRLVIAAYAAGEKPILARGLDYSSEEVYTYVQRIAQQYRAELRRKGGR